MSIILGIDPGFKGGLAFHNDETKRVQTYPMPTVKRPNGKTYIDAEGLIDLIKAGNPDEAWIEDVYSSPQMGVTSAFSFGEGKGTLIGVLMALEVPTWFVAPATWKRKIGVPADKAKTREFARALFAKDKLSTEGQCEAALIALYGSIDRVISLGTTRKDPEAPATADTAPAVR